MQKVFCLFILHAVPLVVSSCFLLFALRRVLEYRVLGVLTCRACR